VIWPFKRKFLSHEDAILLMLACYRKKIEIEGPSDEIERKMAKIRMGVFND